jgi:hypothetical protein
LGLACGIGVAVGAGWAVLLLSVLVLSVLVLSVEAFCWSAAFWPLWLVGCAPVEGVAVG